MKKHTAMSSLAALLWRAIPSHAGAATAPIHFDDFSDTSAQLAEWSPSTPSFN